jgi:hypothetical protein
MMTNINSLILLQEVFVMEALIREIKLSIGNLDRRHVQFILLILTLILLVLGAGAPGAGGDFAG